MKKRYITGLMAIVLSILTSCTDNFENINSNPNNAEVVKTYGIYNHATKSLVGENIRGSFQSARLALPWVQYSAQRNYTEEDRYQYRQTSPGSLFNAYYLQANNFKKIIEYCTDPVLIQDVVLYGNLDNQIAASRIFLAYTFQNLVDTFGDVPYWSYGNQDPDFQALDITNLSPKYATQEKIYTDILKELEEAADMIDLNDRIFYDDESFINENVFGNDPLKLQKFANSLRLRIATRLKNSPLSSLAQYHITDAINDGVMTSNNDSVGIKFENNSVNPAPQYTAFIIDARTDYTVNKTFVDLLKGNIASTNTSADPRLQKMVAPKGVGKQTIVSNNYTESSNLNNYEGMPFGVPSVNTASQRSGASLFGYNVMRADYTEYMMEYSEVEFLLSEANGWDQINYENGVRASMQKWGVSQSNIDLYIPTLPPANQENVINQKYIALFMQPFEAWAEYRRTGFPTFLIKPGDTVNLINPINGSMTLTFQPLENITDLPTRIKYPYTEVTLNGSNYQAASARMGGDNLDTKLIWDTN